MITLSLGLALAADCPDRLRTIDVRRRLDEAYASLEALDIAAFKVATDALDGELPCLADALVPAVVAEIHRTKGIRAFGERQPELAQQMFAASRAIEPGYRFPFALIPDGNPIRDAFLTVDLATKSTEALQAPGRGDLRLDGYSGTERATSWPTLVQYLQADGSVSFTAYLLPGEPVPDYPLVSSVPDPQPVVPFPQPQPVGPDLPPPPPPPHRARVPLLVAAGVTAIGSGVIYGLAGMGEDRYLDPATPDSELDALRSRTNTMVVVSGFGGAAAAGLAIAGIAAK